MSFRTNFIFTCLSSMTWTAMNFGLFKVVYQYTNSIGSGTGWGEDEFFVFLGTIWLINSLVQTFCMQNMERFSEMIRMGSLDFALLKPIDTQFLISFPRINWAQLPNGILGIVLVAISVRNLQLTPDKLHDLSVWNVLAYFFFIGCGVVVMYSLMITLASTSIWLGRNQHLYNFWFYITNFYRYPMEIYQKGAIGWGLWGTFTFAIPILVVSNVPARVLAQPLGPWKQWEWAFAGFAIFATIMSVAFSRFIFRSALKSYRSASS